MVVTRTLLDADASRAKRADAVDKMAAAYILQGALDRYGRIAADAQDAEDEASLRANLGTDTPPGAARWMSSTRFGRIRREDESGFTQAYSMPKSL